MKKKLFTGLTAFLVLTVFSCGINEQNDEQSDGYITLNISEASGSRALDGPIAEALTNFYEATLQRVSDSKIIRVTWNYAQTGRIYLEPGDYKIILMAGRSGTDKILLGVGRVTSIAGKSSDPDGNGSITPDSLQVTITSATTDLYFTAYPLMNNINGVADSTFETELTPGNYPLPTIEDELLKNDIPVFPINRNDTTTAEWKFGLGALPGASEDQINVFGPYIFVTGTPTIYNDVMSVNNVMSALQKIEASFTDLTPNFSTLTGTFNMSFKAPNDDGMVKVALNVPVVAIANSDKPVIWHIRGGLNNGVLDAGAGAENKAGVAGGAILLGF
jgi:hypothetical protein